MSLFLATTGSKPGLALALAQAELKIRQDIVFLAQRHDGGRVLVDFTPHAEQFLNQD